MSIRTRLVAMCLIVALLPAIPLSLLVKNLLDKSFNVGLSKTMDDALESGITISRMHMDGLRTDFEADVQEIIRHLPSQESDSACVAARLHDPAGRTSIEGFLIIRDLSDGLSTDISSPFPAELTVFGESPVFQKLTEGKSIIERRPLNPDPSETQYYDTDDRTVLLAVHSFSGKYGTLHLLIYKRIDTGFLDSAREILDGRQIFAQLRLARDKLSRSFFYPFMIIYGAILIIALLVAFIISERLANPIRRLADATSTVAAGDWSFQLDQKAGGEIGRLVSGFNSMVSHLDTQRRRLIDMEKMASWREMARHLAHEIKNPLLPIRLTVQEMNDQYDGDDDRFRSFLTDSVGIVDDELTRLQALVKEFSSFAKMPGLSVSRNALDRVLHDVSKLYPQARVQISVDPDFPEFLFDPDQIRRVLVNLFDNSLNAVPDGAQPQISMRLSRRDEYAELTYSDNGPGIDPDDVPKIFDPYFTTRESGTGLGLAIVKGIILQHGGTIDVRSHAGGGTTFTIILPLNGPDDMKSKPGD